MSLKRVLKKINRKTIVTLSLIVVIFVMSLGYAALSQYMEIEGVALIDRNWIIKITNVTSSVSSSGVNNSNPYVGSTVTMNATIPNASSKVTYTITLKNEGNLRAKLHSIEQIEDKNTSITYTISGVEAGVTELNPGETNTVTVTIQAASGVSNISNTAKSVMLSFYYVENTVNNSGGNTSGETYPSYSVGDYVMLVDGTRGTVIKDSGASEELITILSETNYGSYPFDSTGSTVYDPTSPTNVGYVVKNTILPQIKSSIDSAGGDSAGTDARLVTFDEYQNARSLGTYIVQPAIGDKKFDDAWMMTAVSGDDSIHTIYGDGCGDYPPTYSRPVTPVIITKKSNIADFPTAILLSNNLQSDDSGISFNSSLGSTDAYGEKLYTENAAVTFTSSTTYHFSSDYSFDASTGKYSLSGTKTSGTWSSMSSNYTKYRYTCKSTSPTGTCTTIYKMTSYTSAISGMAIALTRTSITNLNGQGLYYTAQNNTDDSIYFRGDVKNNYVYFAGIIWRIVRINEDGSIRLITQNSVGNSAFNSSGDNAYMGYMFGTAGSSTYALTHANNNNSTIKTYVDNWYVNNLSSYVSYLADAGFCNDRSIAPQAGLWSSGDTALGYAKNDTFYGAYNRLINEYQPQFACPKTSNDLFTTSTSSKGNKALTYPIGLITADEVAYAGGVYGTSNASMYLTNGSRFWTMSPGNGSSSVFEWYVDDDGEVRNHLVSYDYGVRPVINLKPGVKLTGGNGTSGSPYIITK